MLFCCFDRRAFFRFYVGRFVFWRIVVPRLHALHRHHRGLNVRGAIIFLHRPPRLAALSWEAQPLNARIRANSMDPQRGMFCSGTLINLS